MKRIGRTRWGAIRNKHLALAQRLADQTEGAMLQVAQPAMDHLAGG